MQGKKLKVAALTIVSQFGVNFKTMFLVVQYPDHWLRSSFKKKIPSPADEASFVHLEAQIKCYLKHERTKCSCVVEWFSTADTCKNCVKCRKGFKIGTNEAYNIKIKIRLGGILKIFCFCSHANMAASDKGISLKKKFLKKFLLNVTN